MHEYAAFIAGLEWAEFRRLFDYWISKRDGSGLPPRSAIRPSDFVELLPRIFMVDVMRGPAATGFRFRLVGTEHHAINGKEITGLTLEEAFAPEYVPAVRDVYERVAKTGMPHVARSFATVQGRQHITYDRLLLPLASDGRTVDVLLGYLQPIATEQTFPQPLSASSLRAEKFTNWDDVGDRKSRLMCVAQEPDPGGTPVIAQQLTGEFAPVVERKDKTAR